MMILTTPRLILRHWRPDDLEPFAALNADPVVMEYMLTRLDRAASDAFAQRIMDGHARHGFGLWAVEVPGIAPFVGFVGLSVPGWQGHFMPCVEVGWRLARPYWGKGYATEAAAAAIRYGFAGAGLREIVSFTFMGNLRSRAVMARLGMTRDPADDFDHPLVPKGNPLRPHVLYRLAASDVSPA